MLRCLICAASVLTRLFSRRGIGTARGASSTDATRSGDVVLDINLALELFCLVLHSFEAGIADAISSFK